MEITEVLRHGLITEKSVDLQSTKRVGGPRDGDIVPRYTFRVAIEANKYQIKAAVEAMFPGVKVVRVNTMRMPGKVKTLRTRKAYFRPEARPSNHTLLTLPHSHSIA